MAIYYVDKTTGSDSDTGLTEALAWETINKVNISSFSPNDQILFKKGETWREQLAPPDSGSDGSPITFGSYGSGADPIINGADIISGWTDYAPGAGSTWQATLTTECYQVFMDEVKLVKGSGTDALNDHEWYWASNVLYVRDDTGDPDGSVVIEASTETYNILFTNINWIIIDGIMCRYSNNDGIRPNGTSSNNIIRNCIVEYADNIGIRNDDPAAHDDGLVEFNTVRYCGEGGISLNQIADGWTIQNNTVHNNGIEATESSTFGIKLWCGVTNTITNNIIQYNTVYNNGTGAAYNGVGIWIDECVNGSGNENIVRYNNVYDNQYHGIFIEKSTYQIVYYNLVHGNSTLSASSGGIAVIAGNSTDCSNNLIYNNVVYGDSRRGLYTKLNTTGELHNNIYKNNIFTGNTEHDIYVGPGAVNDAYGSGNVYTYNCIGPESSDFIFWQGNYSTYDAWEAAYGSGTNSVEADPLFIDAASDLFALSGNSPCLNQGTDVSLSTDFVGNSVHATTPDMGALEWGPFYVDSTLGLDTNQGTHTDYPLQTIAAINGLTLGDNDSILFKKGEVWREQLTVPSSGSDGSPITFGAYGSGVDPVISGADDISGDTWSDQTGNVWRKNIGSTEPNVVIFNGTEIGLNLAPDADYEWTYSDPNLDVYAESDPNGYYSQIEAGQRNAAIHTNDKIWITIDGLNLRDGNALGYGTLYIGYETVIGVIVQNSTIERGASSGIWAVGNTTATSLTVNNCVIQNNGGWGIRLNKVYTAGGDLSNNTITDIGWGSIRDNNEYSGIEGVLDNFNVFGNTITGTAPLGCKNGGSLGNYCHGIYALNSTVATNIYSNVIHDNLYGNGVKLKGSANVYRNNIYGNEGSGIECGGNGADDVIYQIFYNLIYNNNITSTGGMNGITEQTMGAGTITLSIYNNTLYMNAGTGQNEFKLSDIVAVLNLKNNIIFTTPTRRTIQFNDVQTGSVAIDYNLQWRADGVPNMIVSGSTKTWEQWQGLGYDTNGVNEDPLFTNPGSDNFTLQSTSPCRDAGTDVSLTEDYAGITVPQFGTQDIGAHEFLDWKATMSGAYRGS